MFLVRQSIDCDGNQQRELAEHKIEPVDDEGDGLRTKGKRRKLHGRNEVRGTEESGNFGLGKVASLRTAVR